MPFPSMVKLPGSGLRSLTREIMPARHSAAASNRLAPLLSVCAAGALVALVMFHGHNFVLALGRALHASWELAGAAAFFEAASIAGYVLLLHRVVSAATPRLRFQDTYDIALAGTAATRLLPTAGLGGAAVTVWALRARGVRPRELTERLLAFLLLLYAVYVAALGTCGAAVAVGIIHVDRGRGLGIVGAALGLGIALVLAGLAAAPALLARLLDRAGRGSGRLAVAARHAEDQVPAVRRALARSWRELRSGHPALLGALASWGFDMAVLLTMLHAFGATLPLPALVLAYFLGTMFNLVPLPGSLSGGLVGVLIALGAPAAAAIPAVLAYRALAVWLPAASGLASVGRLRTSVARWRADAERVRSTPGA